MFNVVNNGFVFAGKTGGLQALLNLQGIDHQWLITQVQLWQTAVGTVTEGDGFVDGLETLGGNIKMPAVLIPENLPAAWQVGGAVDSRSRTHIAEVIFVADVVVYPAVLPASAQFTGLLIIHQPAFFAFGSVFIEVAVVQFAVTKPAGFVSELAFPQHAAVEDMMRHDGGVGIGGNVPVKRQLNIFRLSIFIQGEFRIEKTGHALVADRKAVIRNIQHRYFGHAYTGMPGAADAFVLVEVQFTGGQIPVVLARLTEGEGGVG